MHGFIGIVSKDKIEKPVSIQWKPAFPFQGEMLTRRLKGADFQIEQYSSKKLISEKLWLDNEDILFVTEGTILNLESLMAEHNVTDYDDLITAMSLKNKLFFDKFDGSFAGFLHNKKKNEWFVFNNHTGTKRLFYFQNQSYLIFSTDLYTLTQTLKRLKINYSPDLIAGYLMLNSGYLFEDLTPVKEVKKLRAGEYFRFKDDELQRDYYFHLKDVVTTSDSRETIIQKLDEKFRNAIKQEFQIAEKTGTKHLTTISAGLDSRMVALIAHKAGFQDQQWLNFSEPGYAEQHVAAQIARSYDYPLWQFDLDSSSLAPVDDVIVVNDGLGIYTGCSAIFHVLNRFNSLEVGWIHTGIMGDTVMGSYANEDNSISMRRLFATNDPHKIASEYIKRVISDYEGDVEMAVIYNTIFNNESNGFLYFDLIGATLSPFLQKEFMQYAFSMPREMKMDRSLYVDWILCLHPDIASFTWEAIGGKPTKNRYKRQFYRFKRAALKRLPGKSIWKKGMNPEQFWYDNDENLQNELVDYYRNNIDLIKDEELRNEAVKYFTKGNFDDKARVLTLLASYKLLL